MKKRVSLSLDEKILRKVDSLVDGIKIRSRTDAIEKLLSQQLVEKRTAVILAGGDPSKLYVKELGTYRPLVSIGKKTLIEDIISKAREVGFTNIIIVGFPSLIAKLYEVIGNGEKLGVSINYIQETKELGTAKTLELARQYLKGDFLFLPCDHWFDFDIKELYDFHQMNGGIATLGIHARTSFEWNTSVVVLKGYKVIEYDEFPKKPKTHLISVFIGFMSGEILNYIPPGEVYWSLQEHIFPKLARDGKLVGYPIAGKWVNVHTANDIKRINDILKL